MATATLEKTADPRITSAIGHWGPRFVTNGVALTDFEEVTRAITSWDDWCRAWSARAAVHEAMGREALASKKFLSAGEHLQRTGNIQKLRLREGQHHDVMRRCHGPRL